MSVLIVAKKYNLKYYTEKSQNWQIQKPLIIGNCYFVSSQDDTVRLVRYHRTLLVTRFKRCCFQEYFYRDLTAAYTYSLCAHTISFAYNEHYKINIMIFSTYSRYTIVEPIFTNQCHLTCQFTNKLTIISVYSRVTEPEYSVPTSSYSTCGCPKSWQTVNQLRRIKTLQREEKLETNRNWKKKLPYKFLLHYGTL